MALSPKEREKIVEEERLRFETRQALHAEACAKHPRRGRWLWWAALILLGYAAWCWMACGGGFCGHRGMSCRHGGYGMMDGHGGKPCPHALPDGEDGVKPGQPEKDK